MKRTILILTFLVLTIFVKGQDPLPSDTAKHALPTYSFSFYTRDSSVYIHKGVKYGYTKLISNRKARQLIDSLGRLNSGAYKLKVDTVLMSGWFSNYKGSLKVDKVTGQGLIRTTERDSILTAMQKGDTITLSNRINGKANTSHNQAQSTITALSDSLLARYTKTQENTLLSGKVNSNSAIPGATKTKITYDVKGLVTSGADATTYDITPTGNRQYITPTDTIQLDNLSVNLAAAGLDTLNVHKAGTQSITGQKTFLSKLEVVGVSQVATDRSSHFELSTGTGALTDEKLVFGIHNGDYSWIQAVKQATAYRNLLLNPSGGNVSIRKTTATSYLNIAAPVATAGGSQLKLDVGTQLSVAEGGSINHVGTTTNSTFTVTPYISSVATIKTLVYTDGNITGSSAKWTTPRKIYGHYIDGSANMDSTLAVSYGGTGATTAAGVRTNLGIKSSALQDSVWKRTAGTIQPVTAGDTITSPTAIQLLNAGNYAKMSLLTDYDADGALLIESKAGQAMTGHNSDMIVLRNNNPLGNNFIQGRDDHNRQTYLIGTSNVTSNRLTIDAQSYGSAGQSLPLRSIVFTAHGSMAGHTSTGFRLAQLDSVATWWKQPFYNTQMGSAVKFNLKNGLYQFGSLNTDTTNVVIGDTAVFNGVRSKLEVHGNYNGDVMMTFRNRNAGSLARSRFEFVSDNSNAGITLNSSTHSNPGSLEFYNSSVVGRFKWFFTGNGKGMILGQNGALTTDSIDNYSHNLNSRFGTLTKITKGYADSIYQAKANSGDYIQNQNTGLQTASALINGQLRSVATGGYTGGSEQIGGGIVNAGNLASVPSVARFHNNGNSYITKITLSDNSLSDAYITYSPSATATSNKLGFWVGNTTTGMTINGNGAGVLTSTLTASNFILSSDRRLKKNIMPINVSGLDKIKFVNFELKNDSTHQKRAGVIAQEVEEITPEFVNTDEKGMKSVLYIDLLCTKIAQMDAKIKDLTERVESLEKQDKKNRKHINASKQMIIQ